MIKCDTCPRCKDTYPGKVNQAGVHFYICGMSGNIVYKQAWNERMCSGHGYYHHSVSGCGLYDTIEEALADMTESEKRRYYDERRQRAEDDEQRP